MTEPRYFSVIVLGTGHVGRAFLAQMKQTHAECANRYGIALKPVALADSSGALFAAEGLSQDTIAAALAAKAKGDKLAQQNGALDLSGIDLVNYIAAQGVENAILVDTTATETGAVLRAALEHNYSIALANKRPLADYWQDAHPLYENPRVRFEAAVGAGLPVITTLRYLVDTGDTIQHIEGALSGTLCYMCTQLEDGEPFSSIVNRAKARGYTEPDPREDLSGKDVARKALILARIAGWPKELEDMRSEPLYPVEMADIPLNEFLAELPKLDTDFAAYINAFGGVPRYMAEISKDSSSVALRMVSERLAAQLRGTLNQISFTTERYPDIPLTISGPGAGLEVAASAVLQDCLQLAASAN